ncbi:MAG: hypothetical protein CR960_01615 [Pasteurellales bacterium]|nr:MAG: hypothetical protein CR960_01615 [Pasteurellales bacterium]
MIAENIDNQDLIILKGNIVDGISEIEKRLRKLGATGKGIKQLAESVKGKLPEKILKHILWCNKIRNRLVHPDDNGNIQIPTERDFSYFKKNIVSIISFFERLETTVTVDDSKNFYEKQIIKNNETKDMYETESVVDGTSEYNREDNEFDVNNYLKKLDIAWNKLSLGGKVLTVTGITALAIGALWAYDEFV